MAVQGIENSVLAFLAAVGIAALVWLVAGMLLRGRQGEVPATLVLPVCGGGEALEGWVRAARDAPAAGPDGRDIHCGLRSQHRGNAPGGAFDQAVSQGDGAGEGRTGADHRVERKKYG